MPAFPVSLLRRDVESAIVLSLVTSMFREANHTVIPLKQADAATQLAAHAHHLPVRKILSNLDQAPDLAIIGSKASECTVIEVVYAKVLDPTLISDRAHRILRRWDPSALLVVTHTGFHFAASQKAKVVNGHLPALTEKIVSRELQNKYHDLLMDYL
jgi:hypothetical protein